MSKQNLSESLAQYSVRSFATFLAEQPMTAPPRMTGGAGNGGGRIGKSTPITDHGARGPYAQPSSGDAGGDDDTAPNGQDWVSYIMSQWGEVTTDAEAAADLNGDGIVDGADLAIALGRYN